MTNSKREYNEFIRANLPYGITYDSARYQYVTFNGKRFVTYLEAKWYIDYLTKFGGGPEDDIRNDLFGTSEEGVWFEANDSTTLFTDVAGTTPVTTPGDAVALQLDKSQGLTLGPELADLSTATVSDFDGSAGVIDAVNSRFENTSATTSLGIYPRIIWSALLTPGKTYEVDVVAERLTAVGTGGTGGSNVVVSGSFSGKLVAGSNGNIFFGFDGRETFDVAVSISVRELPGNHRTQATTAARPLYALHPVGGVRNLLEYTEEFDNAVWSKANATVTANAAVAPDGTLTADRLSDSGAGGTGAVYVFLTATVSESTEYTFSFFAKGDQLSWTSVTLSAFTTPSNGDSYFNLSSCTKGTVQSGVTAEIEDVGDGWCRCSVTFTTDATDTTGNIQIKVRDADGGTLVDLDGTSSILIWGAQLEQSSTATNYQRVGSFLDVSEEGKARRGRLWYNGTSHFMQTGTITPGTDKVQVFAGVRKLSDAAAGILVECSANTNSNAGSFYVAAPESASIEYSTLGRGSSAVSGSLRAEFDDPSARAPDSAVLTATHDIAGDLSRIRRNGVFGVDATGDKGTGNFLAYPLYFGARAGTSFFFNGYEDTSIIRFGPNLDDTTISKVESYVASKTPASELLIPAGPELVTNGTFSDGLTGWTDLSVGTGSVSQISGEAVIERIDGSNQGILTQGFSTTVGETYLVTLNKSGDAGGVKIGTTPDGSEIKSFIPDASSYEPFVAQSTTTYVTLRGGVNPSTVNYDNVSVRQFIPK